MYHHVANINAYQLHLILLKGQFVCDFSTVLMYFLCDMICINIIDVLFDEEAVYFKPHNTVETFDEINSQLVSKMIC